MITILVFLLVLLSFALIIGIPVVLASPGEWEHQRTTYLEQALPGVDSCFINRTCC